MALTDHPLFSCFQGMLMKNFNVIYQITNLINGKIYIGAHSTDDICDNYWGSSKLLLIEIKKYGEEFFIREVLSTWPNAEEMFREEERIVNPIFINRTDTYNLGVGGRWIEGDFGWRPKNEVEYRNGDNCERDNCRDSDMGLKKQDDDQRNIYLGLMQDLLVDYGCKVGNESCKTERQQAKKRLLVKHILMLYYKIDSLFSEEETEKFETLISRKLFDLSKSLAMSRKYLAPKIPLTYLICDKFCDWFIGQYYNKYQKGLFNSLLHLHHIEKNSCLFDFINQLIVDQMLIIERCEPSEYLKTDGLYYYIGWLGENNSERYSVLSKNKK
jgi:hypothetical protein